MSADPDMTFEHKLGESGPVVHFRYGSVRFWQRYTKSLKELMQRSDETFTDDLVALVKTAMEGEQDIAESMTYGGLLELAHELPSLATISELQKKRLASESPTPTSKSATDAPKDDAAESSSPASSSAHPAAGGDVVCVTVADAGN